MPRLDRRNRREDREANAGFALPAQPLAARVMPRYERHAGLLPKISAEAPLRQGDAAPARDESLTPQ